MSKTFGGLVYGQALAYEWSKTQKLEDLEMWLLENLYVTASDEGYDLDDDDCYPDDPEFIRFLEDAKKDE